MTNSDSKTPKIKIVKRSETIPQSLGKTVVASWEPKPKGVKPKVLSEQKPLNFQHKVQKKKSKTSSTNPKGPIKIWVPKSEIVNFAYICNALFLLKR